MLAVFLVGCAVGALLSTLLTHADITSITDTQSILLSLSAAVVQIQAGWARPAALALTMLQHPLLLAATLLLLLSARSTWRSCILRPMWLRAPFALKYLLELHSALLGALVVTTLLASSHVMTARPLYDEHSTVMYGLAVHALLPFAIHPGLAPRMLEVFVGRRPIGSPTQRHSARGRNSWRNGRVPQRLRAMLNAAFQSSRRVRRALRLGYASLLLMSVLWILPLTFEATVRWWREEVMDQ